MAYGFDSDFANYEAQQSQRVIDNRAKAWDLDNTAANTMAVNQQTKERQRIEDEATTPEGVATRKLAREHALKDATVRKEWDYAAPLVGAAQDKDPTKFNQAWDQAHQQAKDSGDKAALGIFDDPVHMSPSKYEEARHHVLQMNDYFANSPENVEKNAAEAFKNKDQWTYTEKNNKQQGDIQSTAATTLYGRQKEAEALDDAQHKVERAQDRAQKLSDHNLDRKESKNDAADARKITIADRDEGRTYAEDLYETKRLEEQADRIEMEQLKNKGNLEVAQAKKKDAADEKGLALNKLMEAYNLDNPVAYQKANGQAVMSTVNSAIAKAGGDYGFRGKESDAPQAQAITGAVMMRVNTIVAGLHTSGLPINIPAITEQVVSNMVINGEIQHDTSYGTSQVKYVPSLQAVATNIANPQVPVQPEQTTNTKPKRSIVEIEADLAKAKAKLATYKKGK